MSHSVRRHLRVDVAEYDRAIRRFIPGYEEMLEAAAAAVAAAAPGGVLDLGAGTGALSAVVLRALPRGRVYLLDVDGEMLARARSRLGGDGTRVRFVQSSFHDPLPACDAVVASLALHHLPTPDARGSLFGRLADLLPPGGIFANADVFMPDDPAERDASYRRWADHLVASGIAEEDAWRHFAEWAEEDVYPSLEADRDRLEAAGFSVSVPWRRDPAAVMVARRSS